MKSVGIVVEYNPFHNGHLYHMQAAKQQSEAEIIIAVMSGNFLQRGEPALVSKWSRTKMALQAGIDIVIELPYAFAVQKAETFAYGAVYLLHALQCNSICFGSESGNIQDFINTLQFLQRHNALYESQIRTQMKLGKSYPAALATAFKQLNPTIDTVDLASPNNILGYHYIAAGAQINPNIEFHTIKRKNAEYHDQSFNHDTIASATSIRNALQEHASLEEISTYLPKSSLLELQHYIASYGQFHNWDDYWPLLQYRLLSISKDELKGIYEVEEGLENRLIKAAKSATSFSLFMQTIKTKRYTWTRLQRTCVHILNNIRKETIHTMGQSPQYARLLGMSTKGRSYVRNIKKQLPIPLIAKLSAHENEMLALDKKAAEIYAHPLQEPYRSQLQHEEFSQPPIIINR